MVLLFALLHSTLAGVPSTPSPEACGKVVFLLEHLAAEYPEAVEYGHTAELERQAVILAEARDSAHEVSPSLEATVEALRLRVMDGVDPKGVTHTLQTLPSALARRCGLSRSPTRPLDLSRARRRFEEACAACHGVDGKAHTPAAAVLDPPPAVLGDPDLMDELSPARAFGAITHGIPTTSMPSFATMDEHERWELAHYVFTFRYPACPEGTVEPRATLPYLSSASDKELFARTQETELGCFRAAAFRSAPARARERTEHSEPIHRRRLSPGLTLLAALGILCAVGVGAAEVMGR